MKRSLSACLVLILASVGYAQTPGTVPAAAPAAPVPAGEHLFTIGHSFHANWLPGYLAEVAKSAGIKDHDPIGFSMIGGSRVIEHWNLPDDKNKAKTALKTGKVSVLTMSCLLTPDDGIQNFIDLALEHNPNTRFTLQEFWLPYDRLDFKGEKAYGESARTLRNWTDPAAPADPQKARTDLSAFDVPTADQLARLHAPYFKMIDDYVIAQNKRLKRDAIAVVPVGQTVLALRARIIDGKVPGIAKQSEIFADKLGHPQAVIQTLSAYCHYAVIYHRNPIGLPAPKTLAKYPPELNRLLQELAWDAVSHHPLSGVTADAAATK